MVVYALSCERSVINKALIPSAPNVLMSEAGGVAGPLYKRTACLLAGLLELIVRLDALLAEKNKRECVVSYVIWAQAKVENEREVVVGNFRHND